MSRPNSQSWRGRTAVCAAALLMLWFPGGRAWAQQDVKKVPPDQILRLVEQMSGGGSAALAQAHGVITVAGKPVGGGSPPGSAQAKKLLDVAVGAHPTKHENEPTVAAHPTDSKRMVAGSHYFGLPTPSENRCVAYTSSDRGATWSAPIPIPRLTGISSASDPVVVYAPNGSRVYYVCMDIKSVADFTLFPASFTVTDDWDIIVSWSNNQGATWSAPVIALDGDPYTVTYTPCPSPPFPAGSYCGVLTEPGFAYDKPWIGTHGDPGQSNWVYVTATQFDAGGLAYPNAIAFTGSGNQGSTWGAPQILDIGGGIGGVVVQGSRPTGGLGGEVLVAWYHSGFDGWLNGGFQIRTRRSGDHGATWDSRVVAASDSYEAPFWLGPFAFYKRWWGTMFPDVEIGPNGSAHIVYTHDPVASTLTPEDGDVRYVRSSGPPYSLWSSPLTVNDDGMGRAQGYAAMKLQYGDAFTDPHVQVIFEDTRLSPAAPIAFPGSPNLYYDIFFARKVPGQLNFFSNFRVNEAASIQDYIFTGDYNDLAASSASLFGAWTDRRDKVSIFDFEDDVFGSRIIAGGGAP